MGLWLSNEQSSLKHCRLRVVPLSHSLVVCDAKENCEKKKTAWNPGDEKHAKGVCGSHPQDLTRPFFFCLAFFFRVTPDGLSEKGLLVVYIYRIIFHIYNEMNRAIDISFHSYFNPDLPCREVNVIYVLCQLAKIFMLVLGCWSCVGYKTSSSSCRDETVIDSFDWHEPLYRVLFNTYSWYSL